jgi:hypothetical protein
MDWLSPIPGRRHRVAFGAAAVFAVLALLAISQVGAQKTEGDEPAHRRWRLALDAQDRRVWLDMHSMTRKGSVVTFWLRHHLRPSRRGQILDHWAINCRNRTSLALEASAYDEAGRQTAIAAAPPNPVRIAIVPESNLEAVMECVCRIAGTKPK